MNWKVKAAIQRTCGMLPAGSETVYYGLQRTFGTLRRPTPPTSMIEEAASLSSWLTQAGLSLRDARVMEVGTGRRLDLPFGFFLAGAGAIHTFDLHRYLKPQLVQGSLNFIQAQRTLVENILAPVIDAQSLSMRLDKLKKARGVDEAMSIAGIQYYAPADAARTNLPARSIDVHTSYTVFEHVPGNVLREILVEARRLLAPGGVVLHHVDPSDHFAHDDPSISSINFLQFSEDAWRNLAENQFAYHNRLRADSYKTLFEECGYEVLRWDEALDLRALALLEQGFPLHPQFRDIDQRTLCCSVLRVLARPR